MKVDARELVFIKQNAPSSLASLIAGNTGHNRSTVNNELARIKDEYNEDIITEARRLLKAIKGIEFSLDTENSKSVPV